MRNFELSDYISLNGIGAASGIVYTDNTLFIISDSSSYLYLYTMVDGTLSKIPLSIENQKDNTSKKDKFDIESIVLQGDTLLLFGSGSTSNRNRKFIYNIRTKEIETESLVSLYQEIKNNFNLSEEDINIEGALFLNGELLLFQRGNSFKTKNGIIIVGETMQFIPILLPQIKEVPTTFTDAVLVENKIYFLAAAEDAASTYDDGEVVGSIIGCIDSSTFTIDFTIQISENQKFEGLTLLSNTRNQMEFLLCEDNDTETLVSTIYKLRLS